MESTKPQVPDYQTPYKNPQDERISILSVCDKLQSTFEVSKDEAKNEVSLH